jgi:uncharacterized cupin superfamily protein
VIVPEEQLTRTEHGLVARNDGWFVLNAADAPWRERSGRGRLCDFEGESDFAQVGVNLQILGPGEPMSMYHWESDQEDFLVLSGTATLVIEGQERALRRWDFVHCPAGAKHTIVGAGDGPCAVLCIGGRINTRGEDWGGYTRDETALRLAAGVESDTNDPAEAYARFAGSRPVAYQEGWLPE